MLSALLLAAAIAAASPAPTPAPAKTSAELAREARAAYDKKDYATFLVNYEEIARRRPGDYFVLYNLACGQALSGKSADAERTLLQMAALRAASDLDADTDFDSVRQTEGYRKASAQMKALRNQKISSGAVEAFRIPEKGLVPEGIAYDPKTKSFFVSSIRKREIFRVDASGKVSVFVAPRAGGLRTAAGIGVDPKTRSLWVASESMPHMEGAVKDAPLDTALFEFDADTGKLRREIRPPATDKPAGFDDVAVAADGRVYLNDGFNGRVWTLPPGAKELEIFLASPLWGGTQGMAPTPDGRTLYVSDYSRLYRIDVASKQVTPIAVPADLALNGIDGLVWAGGGLYAIQNGVEPNRVIRLDLAPDGVTVTGSKILEMNHPDFDEPTLGVFVDGVLYVNAGSQGGRFRDDKHPPGPDVLREAVILKIPVSPAAR